MRIVFAGTPQFAVPTLQALIDSPHDVVAVYCQPDRRQGRGQTYQHGPCKQLAQQHHIAVEQPPHFKDDASIATLQHYQADVMIVAAYGLILPKVVLETPPHGCINVHGSLLPQWRGAAPIQRALQAGDTHTGITIMQMDEGLDTGNMLLQETCPIGPSDTHASLLKTLATLGASTLMQALEQLEQDQLTPLAQDNAQASYANKLDKAEADIDWSLSAKRIDQHIRALNPWPVAQTHCAKGRLRVHMSQWLEQPHDAAAGTVIACSDDGINVAAAGGVVRLLQLQLPNQKILSAREFWHGQKSWLKPLACHFVHTPI